MTTEETLLMILAGSIVVLILLVVLVLLIILRRLKQVTADIQYLTEKEAMVNERLAPASLAAISVLQMASLFLKKVKGASL